MAAWMGAATVLRNAVILQCVIALIKLFIHVVIVVL
jgi:hypothetical protein